MAGGAREAGCGFSGEARARAHQEPAPAARPVGRAALQASAAGLGGPRDPDAGSPLMRTGGRDGSNPLAGGGLMPRSTTFPRRWTAETAAHGRQRGCTSWAQLAQRYFKLFEIQ
eukprot:4292539-Prymnesium_polylepis.2